MFTPNQYPVRLSPERRQDSEDLTRNGHAPAKTIRPAQVLLPSDRNRDGGHKTDRQIAGALGMHVNSAARVRALFASRGPRPAIERKPRATPPAPPKIDGRVEAHPVATCCSPPPAGRARRTPGSLAGEPTRAGPVAAISVEAVRQAPKRTARSPGASDPGASRSGTGPGSSPRWRRCSTSTRPGTAPRSR